MSEVTVPKLLLWIKQGRIDPTKLITMKELHDSNLVHKVREGGVKLLEGVRLLRPASE